MRGFPGAHWIVTSRPYAALFDRHNALLHRGRLGVEREALRITEEGRLADPPHPPSLGAPLTHPYITTDYAEPLLELITPPLGDEAAVIEFLEYLHRFVHQRLDGDYLWPYSMPCCPEDESAIPLARYGDSNLGRMKTVYRHGLGLRYGRKMQIIAGIHVNFSMDDDFWRALHRWDEAEAPLPRYRSERYLAQLRNLQRLGWLIPYLFGASPAVCDSFTDAAVDARLRPIAPHTLAEPHATSLRLGDIGYQNRQECETGFKAVYNDLAGYIRTLARAVSTPCPHYSALGVRRGEEFLQLNDHILQIENEYYASVRPKPRLAHPLEMPLVALARRGVEYIELRALDLDPEAPLGVTSEALHFLRLLMLHCLLEPSPPIEGDEAEAIDHNLNAVAHRGRAPGLRLRHRDGEIELRQWGLETLEAMRPLAEALDRQRPQPHYQRTLDEQIAKLADPELTPSARLLRRLQAGPSELLTLGLELAREHRQRLARPLPPEREDELQRLARESHARQRAIEAQPQPPFDRFLSDYFAQLHSLRLES